jgi:hypothetical protein
VQRDVGSGDGDVFVKDAASLLHIRIYAFDVLLPFRGIDVGEASEPLGRSSRSLPNSITRAVIAHFAGSQMQD